jgi:hypothetical protein
VALRQVQSNAKFLWVVCVFVSTCFGSVQSANNRYYSLSSQVFPLTRVSDDVIRHELSGLQARGLVKQKQEDSGSMYFYIPVSRQYVLRLFPLLRRKLQWSPCVSLPAGSQGEAHISLHLQGSSSERKSQLELIQRARHRKLPVFFTLSPSPLIERVEVEQYDNHLHHTVDSTWYILRVQPDFSAWNTLVASSGRLRRALAQLLKQSFHISIALERRVDGRCLN